MSANRRVTNIPRVMSVANEALTDPNRALGSRVLRAAMRIKLRHMEVLGALMEAGSVSRAAARLNLSQPAVSIALSTATGPATERLRLVLA